MNAEEKPAAQSNGVSSPPVAGGAVFLSYASQDAVAAARIATALRAAGIEVWFDESELRGGDVWDQRIRREIQHCALFIPVISHHTQERLEGYFRLEWKLAVDRSHLMAIERSFLVPVVIDGTRDQGALVPDVFRAVQWTRLPAGETSETFIRRLQRISCHSRRRPRSGRPRAPCRRPYRKDSGRRAHPRGRTARCPWVSLPCSWRRFAISPSTDRGSRSLRRRPSSPRRPTPSRFSRS
jgi:hypothetical protein